MKKQYQGKNLQKEKYEKSIGTLALCGRIQEDEGILICVCNKVTERTECYRSGEMKTTQMNKKTTGFLPQEATHCNQYTCWIIFKLCLCK